jgi:hypothetical protein
VTGDGMGEDSGNLAASDDTDLGSPQWQGDVTLSGSLTVHMIPVAQLGIVFNILNEVIPDTVVSLRHCIMLRTGRTAFPIRAGTGMHQSKGL